MVSSADILAAFREVTNVKQIERSELYGLLQDGIMAALAKKFGPTVQAEVEIGGKTFAVPESALVGVGPPPLTRASIPDFVPLDAPSLIVIAALDAVGMRNTYPCTFSPVMSIASSSSRVRPASASAACTTGTIAVSRSRSDIARRAFARACSSLAI
mgnify:CR=1 FL=1